jgi:hypothetical protein
MFIHSFIIISIEKLLSTFDNRIRIIPLILKPTRKLSIKILGFEHMKYTFSTQSSRSALGFLLFFFFFSMLGFELRAFGLLGRYSTL